MLSDGSYLIPHSGEITLVSDDLIRMLRTTEEIEKLDVIGPKFCSLKPVKSVSK